MKQCWRTTGLIRRNLFGIGNAFKIADDVLNADAHGVAKSSGWAARAYLEISQKTFWQSMRCMGRPIGHEAHYLLWRTAPVFGEALRDPVKGAGSGHHELVLIEGSQSRVVEVNGVLEG